MESGPDQPELAVVLVAHGSRAEAANQAHLAMAERVAAAAGPPVWPAFLELASPTIEEAVAQAVASGARTVSVIPFFLYPGRHLTSDIPAEVEQAAASHPGTNIQLGPSFGEDPGVVALLTDQVERLAE